jgi:spermidine/putrescine transport system substrate-binding protein
MKYFLRKIVSVSLASLIVIGSACAFLPSYAHAATSSDTITLRVCNWEEYIDEGDWDETIDLESGDIKGENSMIADFEDWYYKTYGKKVKVEYSCLGTNEELYNMQLSALCFCLCMCRYLCLQCTVLLMHQTLEQYMHSHFRIM